MARNRTAHGAPTGGENTVEAKAILSTQSGPTPLQTEIAQGFFELPESEGFAVHGGLALSALGVTTRPSEDIDLFTSRAGAVTTAADALIRMSETRGWSTERVRWSDTFVRIEISEGPDSTLVDIAQDAPPLFEFADTSLGPTVSEREMLGRKLATIMTRTEPRDFSDLYVLLQTSTRSEAIAVAQEIDLGFHLGFVAESMANITRFDDADFPQQGPSPSDLKAYFTDWSKKLALAAQSDF
ncbi:nucleotidyl transferase AbiEii/AbiGii toxin family protein [Populibacterium corticicola]|uniref:Nucleotidyl transferase AbiEii/AbiGii toxin family protein n=1 Tax=Populibacterium corticicola TaxID=1812826 RepID=A0ABW5XBG3_9MICO